MIKIIYDPKNGQTVPDKRVDSFVKQWISSNAYVDKDIELRIGSEIIIDRFRLAILNEEIDINQIEVWFEDKHLVHNEYGVFKTYPEGFCDTSVNFVERLLMGGIKKRKLLREAKENKNDNKTMV